MALGAVLALSITLGLTTHASADTGAHPPLIIQWGEVVYETGALPESSVNHTDMDITDFRAGYVCDHIAFFWAEITRWNCKTSIIMAQDTYAANPPAPIIEALKKKYSEDDIQMNFWEQHGRWIFLAAFLLYLGMGFLGDDEEDEFAADDESDEGLPPSVANPLTGPVEWSEEDHVEALEIGMTPPAGVPQLGDVLQREANAKKTDGPPAAEPGASDDEDAPTPE
jgi:hypothetical protein